jgi:hypothetical protein
MERNMHYHTQKGSDIMQRDCYKTIRVVIHSFWHVSDIGILINIRISPLPNLRYNPAGIGHRRQNEFDRIHSMKSVRRDHKSSVEDIHPWNLH